MKSSLDKTARTSLVRQSSSNVPAQNEVLPVLIVQAGSSARFAWEEFIYGKIRNPHTRRAYERAIRQFLKHCDTFNKELSTISPRDVGCYLDDLNYAPATKKLHLSAIRHFFDILVNRHVVALNVAASVRGERLQVVEGKTPEISIHQARQLLQSIDIDCVVGKRDRAIIGILIYTAARVGAVAKLSRGDFYDLGDQFCLRFTEKGGKSREIPVRHDLQRTITEYLLRGGLEFSEKSNPLFRTTIRRTKVLTQNAMTSNDMGRMLKRRLRQATLPIHFSPHSFRVAVVTDLLGQGIPLDDGQSYYLPLNQCSNLLKQQNAAFSVFEDIGRRLRQTVTRTDVRQRRARIGVPCKVL